MNTFDQALFYGFLLGVTASATLALGLWLSRNEGRDTILPVADDDIDLLLAECALQLGAERLFYPEFFSEFLRHLDIQVDIAAAQGIVRAGPEEIHAYVSAEVLPSQLGDECGRPCR